MKHKNKMDCKVIISLLMFLCIIKTEVLLDPHQNNEFFAGNYQCPDGWVMRCEKCYLFVEEAKTWTDARYYCQQRGADLVTVKDEATNFFLSRYIRNKSFSVRNVYIGLNDREREGQYKWADGSEAIDEEFRWLPGEPANSPPGEDCVEMYTRTNQFLWNDVPCSDELSFVCQMGGCVEGSNRCDNGKCVSKNALCDGVNDCGDFSDERNCSSCGGYLNGNDGTFTSPNYPNKYGNNRQCSWIIEVPEYHKIELTFQNFSIEEGFDFVEVFDGKTLASKSFGKFNNNQKPTVITSTANTMRVTLISDISNSFEGFLAKYEAIPDKCKEDLVVPKNSHVIIQSPNYPKNYPDSKRCIWNLQNSDPFKSLTMTFIDLDTEEANDIIEVRDGTEKDYVLGQFSGSKDVKLMQPIFSTTKGLWVKFQSNFVNSSKGFKALITAGCYAEMNVSQGIVASPGFGFKDYPNLIQCTWKINEPKDRPITFIFHKFDTERKYDILKLKNSSGAVIAEYSGVLSKGALQVAWILETNYSNIELKFESDVTYSISGFNSTFSIGCPKISLLGGRAIGRNHYGAKITYECDKNYHLKNGKTRTCEYGGKWSMPAPYCEKINCGHPGIVKDGGFKTFPKNGSFDLDSRVVFYCDPGFELIGDRERVCRNDSTWSGSQPRCKILRCDALNAPKNGKLVGNDFTVGKSVRFECNDGFNLNGANTLNCGVDGKWNGPVPTCEAIFCPVLTAPENSFLINYPINVTKVPYRTKVDIRCDPGFQMDGSSQIECVAPGMWEPSLPKCYDINECTKTPSPCKGEGYQCVNSIGSFKCRCLSGFEKIDDITCQDVDECKQTNRTVKCSQSCTNEAGGYKCSCEDGYFLYDGDNTTISGFEAKTAIVNHTCYGVACPIPPIPDEGFVINFGRRYPVNLEYYCNNGYVLKGNRTVKCLKNQTWDKEFPTCIVASCPDPRTVPDATLNVTGLKHPDGSYKLGSRVVYTCNRGYELKSGNARQECIQNKTDSFWSGKLPTCERKSCQDLSAPLNGSVNVTSNKFEGVATYKCNEGFKLIGNDKQTCMDDGKWSGTPPVCAATICPEPGVPLFGSYIGRLELGKTVTYSCYKAGLTLIGEKVRTCLHEVGKGNYWTGTLPSCKDITPPVFNCTSSKDVRLPHSENQLLVNWDVPSVSDSTGEAVVVVVSPNLHPPAILKAGQNKLTYTATDKAGNNATCDVVINVQDRQIPRIKCPSNVVIKSDFPVKVTWGNGVFSDNVGISKVSFNPINGSIFQSGKYHPVKMTVEDVQGNKDICVLEVYVQGCGCESNRSCNSVAPHNKGVATCHINLGVTSCSLTCPKGLSFVQDNFNHDNVMCLPYGNWSRKEIPGCGERQNSTSCLNAELEFKYASINITKIQDDDLPAHFNGLFKYFNSLKTTFCAEVNFEAEEYKLKSTNITTVFKITPKGYILKSELNRILEGCQQELEDEFKNSKQDILNRLSKPSANLIAVNINRFDTINCCGTSKLGYCCPKGHSIRSKGASLETVVCLACSPGMYLNETSNHCTSCPQGSFTSTSANTECTKCPADASTLKHQSVKCIKKCSKGSYSSTGLEPTCRKCDYGEYQYEIGKTECMKCPVNTTTFSRGATNLTDCAAPCPAGEISITGLQLCQKCPKGYYQDQQGRSVCKRCPSGGIYAGKEGAAKVEECPTNNACDLKRCQNEAKCIKGNYSYTCICKPGFKGQDCEIDINECNPLPCQHGGNCTDLVNDYNCSCVEGLKGKNCEININDCKNDTCENSGVCEDLINDFKCWCQPGWEGKRCEKFIDKCLSSPCQHNSTCTSLINSYRCNCTAGYEGVNCETDIDECKSSPCYNNATCVNLINDFECKCQPGFKGDLCAVNIDDCVGKPCKNSGTCIDQINGYKCDCQPGFTGENCSTNVNECDTKPCLRNSTCIDLINKFKCKCEAGYFGERCEFEIDECLSNPCKNNASCIDKVNDFECVCPLGFTGKTCDINIDDCYPSPCQNGTCVDLLGDYRCDCIPGFSGRNCTNLIDNCLSLPCQNNASCINMVNDYTCKCMPGYMGKNCSINIDECSPDPCNGNAVNCTDLVNNFICYCKPGYRGSNCSEEIDNCSPQPCLHNSTCTTVIETNDFHCNCTHGYEGRRCENETNECLSSPCKNNGTCLDKIGMYQCVCPTGFTGIDCEVNIDDCVNVTCQNNGRCIDEVNDYYCQCPVTHKGEHCEKKIPDEVDIKLPGGPGSVIIHTNVSTVDEFSLLIWVRYLGSNSKGVFLVLANKDGNSMTSHFLKVSHENVLIEVAGNVDFFSLNKKINDGLWHHLAVSLSGKTSQCIIALDSQIIINENKDYLKNQSFFKPNGYVILGKNVNNTGFVFDGGFSGEISQFGMWSRVFNENEIKNLAKNCSVDLKDSIIPWIGLMNSAGARVELLELTTCGTNICPAGFTGRFCETLIDKIPPTVVSCPNSTKEISMTSLTRVNWTEPVFVDNVAVVEVLRSHAPRQLFAWGDYVISYIAKDAFNNSATCVFELFVSPHDCPSLIQPNNAISTRAPWLWGIVFDFACQPTYELAVPKPPFYSCGKMGTWSHGPPTYPENPNNLLPSCTATIQPTVTGTNSFSFSTSKCDEDFKNKFLEQFKMKVLQLQRYFKICGETCDFSNIRVRCTDDATRVRRSAERKYELTVSFGYQSNESLTKSLEDTEKLQANVKEDKVELNVTVNGEMLKSEKDKVSIAQPKISCPEGKKLVNETCASCPSGTFRKSNMAQCELCIVGSYSAEGSSNCTICPHGKTTNGKGARNANECLDTCKEGSYFFNNTKCVPCSVGFYKDSASFKECTACPLGKTTNIAGATKKIDCSVSCPLGEELFENKCQPCLEGYYRSDVTQPECVACPYETSTYETGSTTNKCYKKCDPGFESSDDGKSCIPCPSGYYRESSSGVKCVKCTGDKTTKTYGATKIGQCIEKSGTLYDVSMRFTSLDWNEALTDRENNKFKNMAYDITKKIAKIYGDDPTLVSIKINSFREGSVIANMTLSFVQGSKDPLMELRDVVKTGDFDGLSVDPDSWKADFCMYFKCPIDQICWYNTTKAGCVCQNGFYENGDGKCFVTCEPNYCLNGGACVQTDTGRTCRCPKDYSGSRCENSENKTDIGLILGLILGLVFGALFIALILAYCIRRRQRTGKASLYKAQKLENKEEAPLDSMPNTPIIKPVRDNGTVSYAAENRGANLEDDDNETNVTTMTINVEEKDKKVETELKEGDLV